jgi:hypothetical protein
MSGPVQRLRTVSLMTGIIGTVGLPIFVFMKGADVSTGLIAMGMAFVSCSVGSTIAVHTIFSPYVYRIEQIPIRKCSSITKKEDTESSTNQDLEADDTSSQPIESTPNQETKTQQHVLYKAITKSLFLRNTEIVFDPINDMKPYVGGWHPLCNLLVSKNDKDIRLYLHKEFINDTTIRSVMDTFDNNKNKGTSEVSKTNPDDDFF